MNARIVPDHVITIRMGQRNQGVDVTKHTQATDMFHALAVLGASVSTVLEETSEDQIREMMNNAATEIITLLGHDKTTTKNWK